TLPQGTGESPGALARSDPLCRGPAHSAGQQRRGAAEPRPCRGAEELLWLGRVVERTAGGDVVHAVRDHDAVPLERAALADVVPAGLCRKRRLRPYGHHAVPALEPVSRAALGTD